MAADRRGTAGRGEDRCDLQARLHGHHWGRLNAFLRGWTAFYLLLSEEDEATAGLDALELPERLRSDDAGDETFAQITAWASPTITGSLSDPYEALLTAEDVRRIAANGDCR